MKSLQSLIRIHKNELDNLIKENSDLVSQKLSSIKSLENLNIQVEQEINKFAGSEYIQVLDQFLYGSKQKEQSLLETISSLETQIKTLEEHIREKFSELKKFEIALQQRISEEKIKLKKLEEKTLDEFNNSKINSNKNQ